MEPFFKFYIIFWGAACVLALYLLVKDRKSVSLTHPAYWRFLFRPWRLTTFAIACSGMIVIAPYSGDPTWDYFDAFFMSFLTYGTAPWAIGTLYGVIKNKSGFSQAFIAFCVWMFSASWSYDLYLVFRDGDYPMTWFSNIFASSVLYVSAGLFWSLDYVRGRGVTFAFLEDQWPQGGDEAAFSKIILYALLFMVLVSSLILYFFWFKLGR